jgi:hemerythrin
MTNQQERARAVFTNLPFMDEGHERFMAQLAIAIDATDDALPNEWNAMVDLAAENFARDDSWMQATRYAGQRDHVIQHRVVLEVMREGALLAREGKLLQVRQMARQLEGWYLRHAQTMDAALALHLRNVRFDPAGSSEWPRRAAPGAGSGAHADRIGAGARA